MTDSSTPKDNPTIVLGHTEDGLLCTVPKPNKHTAFALKSLGALLDDGDPEIVAKFLASLEELIPRPAADIIAEWQAARGIS